MDRLYLVLKSWYLTVEEFKGVAHELWFAPFLIGRYFSESLIHKKGIARV
jgi:hypothetical protein